MLLVALTTSARTHCACALAGLSSEAIGPAAGKDDMETLTIQRLGRRAPDPAAGAGHQGDARFGVM
jgi:hypothetical protein